MTEEIPFNLPYLTGEELGSISDAHKKGQLAGNGDYTKLCHEHLESFTKSKKAFLTHSCTTALEMAALLLDIKQGDEVIMPSYTFVSTANAFALRGATIVWVDIREDTLNIDEEKIEAAITGNTVAIVVVHYAGVAAEMDKILSIAQTSNIYVVEDAAQGVSAYYKEKHLGSMGHLGCLSFHETKNVISGEGGALLVNDENFIDRAKLIWEKGTNRESFSLGLVEKYEWVDLGSSYLPGEIIAAFLYPQLKKTKSITDSRLAIWNKYKSQLSDLEKSGSLRLPIIPKNCTHNAHLFYIILKDVFDRRRFIADMLKSSINCVFHYTPLHSSPAGLKYGRVSEELIITEYIAKQLIRLPIWVGMGLKADGVVSEIKKIINQ